MLIGVAAAAQSEKTTKDGIFSEEQAKRGHTIYVNRCASCHSDDLSGGTGAPLAGDAFFESWSGQTADALRLRIKEGMPADNPGTLSDQETVDVIAYLLKFNKLPEGPQPLPADSGTLVGITIVKP
jgi:mono/diheme cytochrome c family protein